MEKGTFGSVDEFRVLYFLNDVADTNKKVRQILVSFNEIFKEITESNIESKTRILRLIHKNYKEEVLNSELDINVQSRLNNFFVSKIRKFEEKSKNI